MLWNNYSTANTTWMNEAAAWLANGSVAHLLDFNEPELSYQGNIPPAPAAAYYMQYMQPFAGCARLGAPAVSNDGYEWLLQFLSNCTACTIDFLPIHWYNPWNLTDDLENWVHSICALPGNRSVWVTEVRPSASSCSFWFCHLTHLSLRFVVRPRQDSGSHRCPAALRHERIHQLS